MPQEPTRQVLTEETMAAVPAPPVKSKPAQEEAKTGSIPPGYDQPDGTYADFCSIPALDRIYYAVDGNSIIEEKLDERTWRPAGWRNPITPAVPVPGGAWNDVPMIGPLKNLHGEGPYEPTYESMMQYDCPEWYRDAKFGIWNHWSPSCVAEDGDWYARQLYIQSRPEYKYHCEHFGHPSKFGFKDLCAQWTLLNWQPEELMDLYVKAGAKIFMALANFHDGFDTWNSRHHEWNAQRVGPHRDVIGTWAKIVRERGMRLGVSVHQGRQWWWYQVSHGADQTGPLAGVPYDACLTKADGKNTWWEGLDPQQLYGPKHPRNALPDFTFSKNFYDRTRDLIDQHNPDILYFDNDLLPLGWAGMNIGAYFYNRSLKMHGGMQAVINVKYVPFSITKSVVADLERGVTDHIMKYPWQSETCIGDWHYQRALFNHPGKYGGYLPPRQVIHWMIDAVSKNGTFILNIPGKPDGTIDRKERLILEELAEWFATNGEAIYSTRPWKVFGEGMVQAAGDTSNNPQGTTGAYNGYASTKNLGPGTVRFTRNKAGTVVYAICLGWQTTDFVIRSLGLAADTKPGKIAAVELLGCHEKLSWKQTNQSLTIVPPKHKPGEYAFAFKVKFD